VPPEIALKVDVCNRRALDRGVPALAEVFAREGVSASFFVAFGPDHSGRAIRRIFRRGFLSKMRRTKAPAMYGVKTLLYGTLLPGPPVGESAPDLLRRLEGEWHEVGLHGFDHVEWHDGLARASEQAVRTWTARAAELFTAALGHPPRFSGTPGWQVTPLSLTVQEELGLDFASDTRDGDATPAFYPEVDGKALRTLQVPTVMPTSDEILGLPGISVETLAGYYLERLPEQGPVVIGIHAEAEGIGLAAWLREFLAEAKARGARFVRVSELADALRAEAPVRRVVAREIPGRAGTVGCPEAAATLG
jgi:peptidoglycan/xylan/chitin deacetylase (PgdA/CDA1 family)